MTTNASINQTLANAQQYLHGFESATGQADKTIRGIRPSEMFFLYATVGDHQPRQIIESGRALGQSTYQLGQLYPQTPIVSIEYDIDHPDSPKAVDRLKPFANITCLFGDARTLIPAMVLPGDVIVIDGPKDLRAIKLMMNIFDRCPCAYVFIHDCALGSPARQYLQKHVPWAFYSDDPTWVSTYCKLDQWMDRAKLACWLDPATHPPGQSYGGTFACIACCASYPTLHDKFVFTLGRWAGKCKRALGL